MTRLLAAGVPAPGGLPPTLRRDMAHRVTYFFVKDSATPHRARCRCGQTSKQRRTKEQAEDDVTKHRADVERLKLQMQSRNPTLESQRDYYRSMADNPEVALKDRKLWGMLADELDIRLGVNETQWA